MANSGILVINAAYDNDHTESVGQPGPQFTAGMTSLIAVKDIHPWKSPQRKLGEISVLSVALTSFQINPSCFFSVAVQLLLTCKTTLIYSNMKGNYF